MNIKLKNRILKMWKIIPLIAFCLLYSLPSMAQDVAISQSNGEKLFPNQNPRYKESYAKYNDKRVQELVKTQGQTLQDTYKAIDYLQDRRDARRYRKNNRFKFRQERRLARINNRRRNWGNWGNYGSQFPYSNRPFLYNDPWSFAVPTLLNAGLWLGLGSCW